MWLCCCCAPAEYGMGEQREGGGGSTNVIVACEVLDEEIACWLSDSVARHYSLLTWRLNIIRVLQASLAARKPSSRCQQHASVHIKTGKNGPNQIQKPSTLIHKHVFISSYWTGNIPGLPSAAWSLRHVFLVSLWQHRWLTVQEMEPDTHCPKNFPFKIIAVLCLYNTQWLDVNAGCFQCTRRKQKTTTKGESATTFCINWGYKQPHTPALFSIIWSKCPSVYLAGLKCLGLHECNTSSLVWTKQPGSAWVQSCCLEASRVSMVAHRWCQLVWPAVFTPAHTKSAS